MSLWTNRRRCIVLVNTQSQSSVNNIQIKLYFIKWYALFPIEFDGILVTNQFKDPICYDLGPIPKRLQIFAILPDIP